MHQDFKFSIKQEDLTLKVLNAVRKHYSDHQILCFLGTCFDYLLKIEMEYSVLSKLLIQMLSCVSVEEENPMFSVGLNLILSACLCKISFKY